MLDGGSIERLNDRRHEAQYIGPFATRFCLANACRPGDEDRGGKVVNC